MSLIQYQQATSAVQLRDQLELAGGATVPMSRTYRAQFEAMLGQSL